jgi:hypothetical protein
MVAGLSLDQRVGDYMSGDGGHSAHGGSHGTHGGQPKGKKRGKHEVAKEHQDLYDKIIESFDPEFHIATTKNHNKAYGKVVSDLADKTYETEHEAAKALTDVLIKYRKEAGLPVSDKDEHKPHIYNEVRQLMNAAKQGKFGDSFKDLESMYKSGRLMQFFNAIHQKETTEAISAKVSYNLHELIPDDQDPEVYQGILGAHGNYVGHKFSKGDLAAAGNKPDLVDRMLKQYGVEVDRMITEAKPKKGHDGHGADHGAGHH